MSQTSVGFQADVFPGVLNGFGPRKVDSYVQGEASAEIPFGTLVVDDAAGGMKKYTGAETKCLGILAHSHDHAKPEEVGSTGLKPDAIGNVLSYGEIWVLLEETVNAGDPVRVSYGTGMGETVGAFRTTEPGDNDTGLLSGARYMQGGEAGGVALLWIDALNCVITPDVA